MAPGECAISRSATAPLLPCRRRASLMLSTDVKAIDLLGWLATHVATDARTKFIDIQIWGLEIAFFPNESFFQGAVGRWSAFFINYHVKLPTIDPPIIQYSRNLRLGTVGGL